MGSLTGMLCDVVTNKSVVGDDFSRTKRFILSSWALSAVAHTESFYEVWTLSEMFVSLLGWGWGS